ncbi:DUF6198 family protein [Paraclostridium sordellii]|uniref:DUF6198 family protein n=1 Tax=Paraclostridium sordellii TaxID=1505 RepID=UPI0005DC1E8E|nr:DUF6198 family protein [Paeniclostridium sordellii]CEO06750.1 integral membrane protein [[Clostridium] sordellii] [Paeniclostridium sordellii]CEP86658.1 integral membrane protein [[Clostridium] sordellii] [Paeniclostridium sordellii]CEP99627.1 integral membrane protein [[Clostridium] sordellii] [Paeniclostridium sordellii]
MKIKKSFSSELSLLIGLLLTSFANTLMVKSGLGISAISAVPYSLSFIFDKITFGSWNYIFQSLLIVLLVTITKKFKFQYIVSFLLSVVFGALIDFFNLTVIQLLPDNFLLSIVYFTISFLLLAIGISLQLNCGLPILPLDTFTKDLSKFLGITYKKVKTIFDLSCLATTLFLSIIVLNTNVGLGIGTIICALFTGKIVSIINNFIDNKFYFKSVFYKK